MLRDTLAAPRGLAGVGRVALAAGLTRRAELTGWKESSSRRLGAEELELGRFVSEGSRDFRDSQFDVQPRFRRSAAGDTPR